MERKFSNGKGEQGQREKKEGTRKKNKVKKREKSFINKRGKRGRREEEWAETRNDI